MAALALLAACGPAAADAVETTGDRREAALVLQTIRAAEARDEAGFRGRIGKSAVEKFNPPTMAEVDRTGEGCTLRSIDASIGVMVSVLWSCPNDTRPNIQRTFVVERDRITHAWNDWAEVL